MKYLVITSIALTLASCGERIDTAEKSGIIVNSGVSPFSLNFRASNSTPDTMSAFTWPSREYYDVQYKQAENDVSHNGEKCVAFDEERKPFLEEQARLEELTKKCGTSSTPRLHASQEDEDSCQEFFTDQKEQADKNAESELLITQKKEECESSDLTDEEAAACVDFQSEQDQKVADEQRIQELTATCGLLNQKQELILKYDNYVDFVTEVSRRVNVFGKEFDERTIWLVDNKGRVEDEIRGLTISEAMMATKENLARAEGIKASEGKKFERASGKVQKAIDDNKEKTEEKTVLTTSLEEANKESQELNCTQASEENAQRCQELQNQIKESNEKIAKLDRDIERNNNRITREKAKAEEAGGKVQIAGKVLEQAYSCYNPDEKKEIQEEVDAERNARKKGEITLKYSCVKEEQSNEIEAQSKSLKLKIQDLIDELRFNAARQTQSIAEVNKAVDPHTMKEDNYVNWMSIDAGTSSVRIFKNTAEIKIMEMGPDKISYQTVFTEVEGEEESTVIDETRSDIFAVSYEPGQNGRGLLKFKLREKDKRGIKTGRIYDFVMERSNFASSMVVILGDMKIYDGNGHIVAEGQAKALQTMTQPAPASTDSDESEDQESK